MTNELTVPKTLRDAIVYYSDEKTCHELMVAIRFPNGLCCVHCGDTKSVKYLESVKRFKCYSCRKQFSLKTGTVLEDSPISFTKWLPAFWLLTSAKNGISSCELARSLGVTQKTAWFMLHRIRHIMQTGTFEKMDGTVEADETFIGGLEKNKHEDKKLKQGRGTVGKTIVMGILERNEKPAKNEPKSRVRAKVVQDTTKATLQGEIKASVEQFAEVYTDAWRGYNGLSDEYLHQFVDHAVRYAIGRVHTNSLENFWALLKRCLKGTYISVEPFHLMRYIDEQVFRFNNRAACDSDRFLLAVGAAVGKRLTYDTLTRSYEGYYDEVLPR